MIPMSAGQAEMAQAERYVEDPCPMRSTGT